MKKDKAIFIQGAVIAAAMVLVGGWYVAAHYQTSKTAPTEQKEQAQTTPETFKEQYPRVSQDNRFNELSDAQAQAFLNSGTGVLFLGYPACPWCQRIVQFIDEASRAEGVDVQYINLHDASDDVKNTIQIKMQAYQKTDEKPQLYVPQVFVLQQGVIVKKFVQEEADPGEDTPDTYWTKERGDRATEQLKTMIQENRAAFDGADNHKTELEKKLEGNAMLIDVRTNEEWNEGHIAGAKHIALQDIQSGTLPNVDKNTTIYLYCRSGARASQAAAILQQAGFSDVHNLGGIMQVQQAGGVIEK